MSRDLEHFLSYSTETTRNQEMLRQLDIDPSEVTAQAQAWRITLKIFGIAICHFIRASLLLMMNFMSLKTWC